MENVIASKLYETAAGMPPREAPIKPGPLNGLSVAFQVADEAGCGGYRCILPAAYLRELGAEVKWTNKFSHHDLSRYNVFIYQRPYGDPSIPHEIRMLSESGKLTIVESDDNLYKVSPNSPVFSTYKPGTQKVFADAIKAADGMIVSTPELARFYYKMNRNIAICVNSADLTLGARDWSGSTDETGKKPGEVVVGWRGGSTHQDDLKLVDWAGILKNNPSVRLALYSNPLLVQWVIDTWKLDKDRVTVIPPRNFQQYPSGLSGIDIMLVPLVQSEFNDGKSELALIEAGALGIPTVCSSSAAYIRFADGNKDTWKFAAVEGWGAPLTKMIEDTEYRKSLGALAKQRVVDTYSYETNVYQWASAIDNIWNQKIAGNKGPGENLEALATGPNKPCPYCRAEGVENPPKTKKCTKHRR